MKKSIKYILLIIGILFISTANVKALGSLSYDTIQACGFNKMPARLPVFTSNLYKVIKVLVPIILIVMGLVDLVHAMMLNDENNMKKSQKKLITRLIAAIAVFLIMSIVQFVFKTINFNGDTRTGFTYCMDCLLNNRSCGAITSGKASKSCEERGTSDCKAESINNLSCDIYNYNGQPVCRTKCENYDMQACSKHSEYCRYNGVSCIDKPATSDTGNESASNTGNNSETPSTEVNNQNTTTSSNPAATADTSSNTSASSDTTPTNSGSNSSSGSSSTIKCSSCERIPSSSDRAKCKKNWC